MKILLLLVYFVMHLFVVFLVLFWISLVKRYVDLFLMMKWILINNLKAFYCPDHTQLAERITLLFLAVRRSQSTKTEDDNHVIVKEVSCWPVTLEDHVHTGQSLCGFWWTKWHCNRFFSQYHSTAASYLLMYNLWDGQWAP